MNYVTDIIHPILKNLGWNNTKLPNHYTSPNGNCFNTNHFGIKGKGPAIYIYNEVVEDIKYDETTGLLLVGDYAAINLKAL